MGDLLITYSQQLINNRKCFAFPGEAICAKSFISHISLSLPNKDFIN